MSAKIKRIGIIGGSGLGDALSLCTKGEIHNVDTPFGKPSGAIVTTELESVPIAFLSRHGEGHFLNPSRVPYRANIYALRKLGVRYVIGSGACGSLVEEVRPGNLVVADQVIDKTWRRENTFFDELAVHVDFAYPFCERLRKLLLAESGQVDTVVHDGGTYVCMEGPSFSTRAESLLHRQWGGHLIGMTCMPEARLAREAQMCYAMVGLATDYDCWREHKGDVDKHSLMKEIIENLNAATQNGVKLISAAVAKAGELLENSCEHHSALELGIWSDRSRVPKATREKLSLLLDDYIEGC